jgi:alanine racemase
MGEITSGRSTTAGGNSVAQATIAHPSWREIELDALCHNYDEIRRRIGPDVQIIGSVKGNAYGHGVVEVVRALQDLGVYSVATGSFSDAVALRRAGIDCRIQMFPGFLPEAIPGLLALDLMPSITDLDMARAVSETARRAARVYIKVDCGLGRLGVRVEEAEAFVKAVASLPRVVVEGIFTHLPFTDLRGRDWAFRRLAAFESLLRALERAGLRIPISQVRASSAIAAGLKDACTAVCAGHLLYGGLGRVTPEVADLSSFRPVLKTIRSRLIHVGRRAPEALIGTGAHDVPESVASVGVLPIGLFDGYRNASAGRTAAMLYQGQRVRVLAVNLEYTVVDLTPVGAPAVGDEVVVLGESNGVHMTMEEIAACQGTSPVQVLMNFDQRMPSIYSAPARKKDPAPAATA